MCQAQGFAQIKQSNPTLATKIESQGFCVTADDVPGVVAIMPKLNLLVVCGCGRFTTNADSVAHFVDIINKSEDYVRHVSIAM